MREAAGVRGGLRYVSKPAARRTPAVGGEPGGALDRCGTGASIVCVRWLPLPLRSCGLFVAWMKSARPYGVTVTFLDFSPTPAVLMAFTRYTHLTPEVTSVSV